MPKGEFYIGWEQLGNNHLDVGYDINNGNHETESSDNLFWSDRGNWTAVNFKGALMMRPYVGKKIILGKANVEQQKKQNIICYPNPFTDKITVDNSKYLLKLIVFDVSGKQIGESESNEIDMSLAKPGVYTLQVTTQNGDVFHQKMIKLR